MKIDSAFRPLTELERSLAELYGGWADTYEADREAAFVFFKMSSEEKGHAALVDYARRTVQRDPKLGGDVDIDLTLVQGMINKVRVLRESGSPSSVEKAVEIALELEASAAESHYKNALKQVNPEMERLLKCLGGEDQAHLERLKQFAAKRSPVRTSA